MGKIVPFPSRSRTIGADPVPPVVKTYVDDLIRRHGVGARIDLPAVPGLTEEAMDQVEAAVRAQVEPLIEANAALIREAALQYCKLLAGRRPGPGAA